MSKLFFSQGFFSWPCNYYNDNKQVYQPLPTSRLLNNRLNWYILFGNLQSSVNARNILWILVPSLTSTHNGLNWQSSSFNINFRSINIHSETMWQIIQFLLIPMNNSDTPDMYIFVSIKQSWKYFVSNILFNNKYYE